MPSGHQAAKPSTTVATLIGVQRAVRVATVFISECLRCRVLVEKPYGRDMVIAGTASREVGLAGTHSGGVEQRHGPLARATCLFRHRCGSQAAGGLCRAHPPAELSAA